MDHSITTTTTDNYEMWVENEQFEHLSLENSAAFFVFFTAYLPTTLGVDP